MDEEDIIVNEGNDGSRRRKKKESKRESSKRTRYADQDPELENFRRPCNHNGPTYECAKVEMEDISRIRKDFYEEVDKIRQDIKLCHFISVMPVKRHRSTREIKQRNATVAYLLKSRKTTMRICKTFFIAVFGVTNQRIATVSKALEEGAVPKERRGGDKISHKIASKKEKVRSFIGQLRGKESHYNRSKSKRIYLSANLSVAKLQKLYNRKCGAEYRVSYDMFRNVFINDFNIGFSSPASDVCSKCTRLQQQLKHENDLEKKKEIIIEYRIHRKRANTFFELARENPDNTISFCFDLQQVQPLPRTPIGDAFYAHQISWYAFCCVSMTSRNPTFYVWTEDLAGRGATQIGSALMHHLDGLNFDGKHCIRLFCDGCGGQNKNSHIIHTLMYWLKNKSPENISEIIITFPVRGHSFLPADRAFGRVEKILRQNPIVTHKKEYVDLYSEVGTVQSLGSDWKLYDIKELEKTFKKIKGISECKRISVKKFETNNKVNVRVLLNHNLKRSNKVDDESLPVFSSSHEVIHIEHEEELTSVKDILLKIQRNVKEDITYFNVYRREIFNCSIRTLKRKEFDPYNTINVLFSDVDGITEGAIGVGGPTREMFRLLIDYLRDSQLFVGENLYSAIINGIENCEPSYSFIDEDIASKIKHIETLYNLEEINNYIMEDQIFSIAGIYHIDQPEDRARVMKDKMKDAKNFIKLLIEELYINVNRNVAESQMQIKRRKHVELPIVEDKKLLRSYTITKRDSAFEKLLIEYDNDAWLTLAESTLLSMQIFNRRRPGELERILIANFSNHQTIESTDRDLFKSLSEANKTIANKYMRFEIRGKLNRTVSVLIDNNMLP
ncbi:unnamed protein product [Phaedon cochleariae]|uniref:DUF7869 domain-containing protein n=1 Tax=Phaedon cochleariae TaxID=80249 RepID=A0A9N9SI70_PHACE|nr:unnamed protein product [Phaedon cochleariae]